MVEFLYSFYLLINIVRLNSARLSFEFVFGCVRLPQKILFDAQVNFSNRTGELIRMKYKNMR